MKYLVVNEWEWDLKVSYTHSTSQSVVGHGTSGPLVYGVTVVHTWSNINFQCWEVTPDCLLPDKGWGANVSALEGARVRVADFASHERDHILLLTARPVLIGPAVVNLN